MTFITSTYEMHVKNHPEKIAVYTENEAINYRDWQERIHKTANWLTGIVGKGGKVGILLPNGIPFLQLFAGASAAGLIAVPLDMKWKRSELEQRLALAKPSIVMTTKALAQRYRLSHDEVLIWEEVAEDILDAESVMQAQADEKTLFYMGFTSGTTGVPKAFVRHHQSWIKSFSSSRNNLGLSGTDHVLIPGALVHSHFLYGAICTLYLGGTVYLQPTFSPRNVLDWMQRLPITVIYTVPTMNEAIAAQSIQMKRPIKIISSGAKWNEASKNKIREQFPNMTMYEFYGASELSFVTYSHDTWNQEKPMSVGKACDGVRLEIRDANGNEVKNGMIGKIYVKSPLLFAGYVQPNTDILQTLQDQDGWVTVDDLGYLDDEGFLYLVGREKNMIICGGENVYPEEVEAVLLSHPDITEAAVIGVENRYWGQVPVAFIQGDVSKCELRKLCRDQLSTFKVPKKWHFVEEFDYTTSGKIARHALEKLLPAEVGQH
ncbi:AMP-binding protein [Sporosarcina ureilytica]|uniref:Acyl-CoA synthetase n=1 Tax=Sporosarcina ureilytica TaxID=298596 RepID=A0A1D8JDF1_9BACL|nr:AMP-binding protein [Sporosarcina ureilytica]AOV06731.1 hypothetical protein BI350_03405 [Sporosarcina ureilytica]